MLPNEVFALKCRERYAEDGLVVDDSNGHFAHCPLPKKLGEKGYYLLWEDHQWQGLLQSRDVGRKCFWAADVKKWLLSANFVEGYFDLWDIYEEFTSRKHNPQLFKPGVSRKNPALSERNKLRTGKLNPMFGRTGELNPMCRAVIATNPEGAELCYGAVREAARELGVTHGLLINKFLKTNKIVSKGKFKGWQFKYS